MRDGLRALLSDTKEIEVIGEAGNGHDAIRMAVELQPDLILMDLSMPGTNGTEAIPAIKRRLPDIKIIVLTVHKTEEYVRATLNAGADGYVLKDESQTELIAAIQHVFAGKNYLSPGICKQVVSGFISGGQQKDGMPADAPTWDTLTVREREILKLIAEGNRNKEIATYLSISIKTVEKHRSNLMRKLKVHNASELTAYAIENRLIIRS